VARYNTSGQEIPGKMIRTVAKQQTTFERAERALLYIPRNGLRHHCAKNACTVRVYINNTVGGSRTERYSLCTRPRWHGASVRVEMERHRGGMRKVSRSLWIRWRTGENENITSN